MINPVLHGRGGPAITQYKVEPYVMTADVYGVSPHEGRGGWSWYTGSAAWMYRLVVESLLGLSVIGDSLERRTALAGELAFLRDDLSVRETPFRIRSMRLRSIARSMPFLMVCHSKAVR